VAPFSGQPGALSIDTAFSPALTKFAYIANYYGSTVSSFSINNSTGLITATGNVATGLAPWSLPLVFSPTGDHVFASYFGSPNVTPGGVSAYVVDPGTGTLSGETDIPTGQGAWENLSLDPVAPFAYQVDNASHDIATFQFSGGTLNRVGASMPADAALALTVEPRGRYAYLLQWRSSTAPASILAYSIAGSGPNAGSLTQIVPPTGFTQPVSDVGVVGSFNSYTKLAVDPSGSYIFLADTASNSLSVYAIDQASGAAAAAVGSPYRASGALGPATVTFDNSGRFAYVLNQVSNNISVYAINVAPQCAQVTSSNCGQTGLSALTYVGLYNTGGLNPQNVVVDPSNRFLYVSNQDSGSIGVFFIDQTTGALTPTVGSPFAVFPSGAGNGPGPITILR
jgi:6-phosphogluconolactonase (cycloisomerase 2 family)